MAAKNNRTFEEQKTDTQRRCSCKYPYGELKRASRNVSTRPLFWLMARLSHEEARRDVDT